MTELEKREQRIEQAMKVGKGALVAIYKELAGIAEDGLVPKQYSSFSDYCERKWKMSRQRGFQILEYVEILNSLPEKCQQLLTLEGTARALKNIPPEEREKVIEKAAKSGKVTSASIAKAAKEEDMGAVDKMDFPIPDEILETWNEAEEMSQFLLSRISQVKVAVEAGLKENNAIYGEISNGTLANIKNVNADLKRIEPYAICTSCSGHPKKCKLCHGRGFISKFTYETCTPSEKRTEREGR